MYCNFEKERQRNLPSWINIIHYKALETKADTGATFFSPDVSRSVAAKLMCGSSKRAAVTNSVIGLPWFIYSQMQNWEGASGSFLILLRGGAVHGFTSISTTTTVYFTRWCWWWWTCQEFVMAYLCIATRSVVVPLWIRPHPTHRERWSELKRNLSFHKGLNLQYLELQMERDHFPQGRVMCFTEGCMVSHWDIPCWWGPRSVEYQIEHVAYNIMYLVEWVEGKTALQY